MSITLRDFVTKAVETNRIRFADLRRLQRDVLPYRITSRDEAELVLALDAAVERADRDWREYVVPAVAQFVIWGMEPVGRIDQVKAEWLLRVLGDTRRKTGSAIIRCVVTEAPWIDDTGALRSRPSRNASPSAVECSALPVTLPAGRVTMIAGP